MESGAADMIGDTVKLLLKCKENGEVLNKQAPPSIYMVPTMLRDLSPSSFTPTVVAIGPLHSQDEHLQEFEVQKTAYFHKWLHRLGINDDPEKTLRNYVEKVIHSIEGIKACYAGVMTYTDSELAKMMVIDACFILEFIQSHFILSGTLSGPNILIAQSIYLDILLIENQIPFFVLKIIFDCTILASGPMTDGSSLAKYIEVLVSGYYFIEEHVVEPDALSPDPDHILGFLHKYFQPAEPMPPTSPSSTKRHTAMELDRAGMKFKPINENKNWVLDMKLELPLPLFSWMVIPQFSWFRRPTMWMPKLKIHDQSELILRNLIVYEQSSDVEKYVTSYVFVLDMLIDTPQDVALLIKSQVLTSYFGSNEEAADMINKLCKNIPFSEFFHEQQWEGMDVYYNSYWPNTLAGLKRTYFNNPWNIIALIAAFVLFALTITQTITVLIKKNLNCFTCDNVIVGSKDGKLCWFDMDLSSKPYKILKSHPKDITNVAFHRNYPLFASCSDDCTAYVFHGMVYSDLNTNPLIVPLEILHRHTTTNGRGVLDCKFHPRQPWFFSAGLDSVVKLFCH
ncbi:hypothetical protein LXL04_038766 [Taraxacum kok-saghyz]